MQILSGHASICFIARHMISTTCVYYIRTYIGTSTLCKTHRGIISFFGGSVSTSGTASSTKSWNTNWTAQLHFYSSVEDDATASCIWYGNFLVETPIPASDAATVSSIKAVMFWSFACTNHHLGDVAPYARSTTHAHMQRHAQTPLPGHLIQSTHFLALCRQNSCNGTCDQCAFTGEDDKVEDA